MNKKGFTLVEILCVIVILAIITTIASANIVNLTRDSKEKLYCTKLELIKTSAKNYARKYEKELSNSTNYDEGYPSLNIKVSELVEAGVYEADKDGVVLNPKDNSSMNNIIITLYLKNNQINAYIETNNVCEN